MARDAVALDYQFRPGDSPRLLGADNMAAGGHMVVPGGDMLLHADYTRAGSDLLLEGKGGEGAVLVRDYFTTLNAPDLVTGSGAVVRGDLATRLAGPLAPGQYAQAAATPEVDSIGADSIGKVDNLAGGVTITRADGVRIEAVRGTPIFADDVIATSADGKLGIVFTDHTTFSLGGDGRMVIDEMIYDPQANTGSGAIDVLEGTFSFVSGKIAKVDDDAMTVTTPVATIGIRGTTVAGHAAAEGDANTITLLPDADGGVGVIGVTSGGVERIMSVPFQSTIVTSAFVPPAAPVILSAAQVQEQYGEVAAIMPSPPATDDADAAEGEEGEGEVEASSEGEEGPIFTRRKIPPPPDSSPDSNADANANPDPPPEGEAGPEGEGEGEGEETGEGGPGPEEGEGGPDEGETASGGEEGEQIAEGPGPEDVAEAAEGAEGGFSEEVADGSENPGGPDNDANADSNPGANPDFTPAPPDSNPGTNPEFTPAPAPIFTLAPTPVPAPIFTPTPTPAPTSIFTPTPPDYNANANPDSNPDPPPEGGEGGPDNDSNPDPPPDDVPPAKTTVFAQTIDGTLGDDNLLGDERDTQFRMSLGRSLRGADTADGGGGVNELAFENLEHIHFVYDFANGVIEYARGGPDEFEGHVTFTNIQQIFASVGDGAHVRMFADDLAGGGFRYILVGTDANDLADLSAAADARLHGSLGTVPSSGVPGAIIFGKGGDDFLFGGAGNDIIHGGAGNDIIHGGAGNDIIHGGEGFDALYGDAGDDTLITGGGGVVVGGRGDDVIILDAGKDIVVFRTAADNGHDTIKGFDVGADGDILRVGDLGFNPRVAGDSPGVQILSSGETLEAGKTVIVLKDAFYVGVDGAGGFAEEAPGLLNFLDDGGLLEPKQGGKLLFVVDTDAGNPNLWYWSDDDGEGDLDAGEFTQVATLENVDISDLTADNFALY